MRSRARTKTLRESSHHFASGSDVVAASATRQAAASVAAPDIQNIAANASKVGRTPSTVRTAHAVATAAMVALAVDVPIERSRELSPFARSGFRRRYGSHDENRYRGLSQREPDPDGRGAHQHLPQFGAEVDPRDEDDRHLHGRDQQCRPRAYRVIARAATGAIATPTSVGGIIHNPASRMRGRSRSRPRGASAAAGWTRGRC